MTIKIKKKICNECETEAYIFSKGRCKPCADIEYRRKAIENRRAKKGTKGKAKNYKSIPRVSKSMQKKLAIYKPLRDEYMKEHPICEFKGCNKLGESLHHMKPRDLNLCNVDIFMSICNFHHVWVHDNHAKSVEMGYL